MYRINGFHCLAIGASLGMLALAIGCESEQPAVLVSEGQDARRVELPKLVGGINDGRVNLRFADDSPTIELVAGEHVILEGVLEMRDQPSEHPGFIVLYVYDAKGTVIQSTGLRYSEYDKGPNQIATQKPMRVPDVTGKFRGSVQLPEHSSVDITVVISKE